jgi:hypothetical protein
LVVPGGVECEVAQNFSGGGVDDGGVEVLDEDEDAGSVVVAADADVVEASVDAQGDGSGLVDAVGADAVMTKRAFDTSRNWPETLCRCLETRYSDVLKQHTVPATNAVVFGHCKWLPVQTGGHFACERCERIWERSKVIARRAWLSRIPIL